MFTVDSIQLIDGVPSHKNKKPIAGINNKNTQGSSDVGGSKEGQSPFWVTAKSSPYINPCLILAVLCSVVPSKEYR